MAQQLAAINLYTQELNNLTTSLSADVRTLAQMLLPGGMAGITLTSSNILQFEQQILVNGLPSQDVTLLTDLGFTPSDINLIEQTLYSADINSLSGIYPNVLDAFADQLAPAVVPEPAPLSLFVTALALLFGLTGRGKELRHLIPSVSFIGAAS